MVRADRKQAGGLPDMQPVQLSLFDMCFGVGPTGCGDVSVVSSD